MADRRDGGIFPAWLLNGMAVVITGVWAISIVVRLLSGGLGDVTPADWIMGILSGGAFGASVVKGRSRNGGAGAS